MNERIKELAREAGLLAYNPAGNPTKLDKFAELIVAECIHCVLNGRFDEEKFNADDLFDQGHNKALNDTAKGIKQYFGVEA